MAGTEKTAAVMPGGGGAGGSAPPPAPWTGPSWAAGLHHKLHDFVKKGLLKQLMFPGATVCDLFCGRGPDTAKWAEAGTGHYIGVDLSASALEEAREEWIGRGKPYPAFFCELDPCMKNLHARLEGHGLPADVVCCLGHLQDCFSNEEMLKSLLNNVATLLKPGGMFFGITPDSSTIWYKYQKAVEGAMKTGSLRANGALPRVKNELFTISFENDRFNFYGTKYQLRFADDGLPPQAQLLVHFPSLIRIAKEVGLECVEIQNLFDFYEDFRTTFAEALRSSCGTVLDPKGRLPNQAHEVLSLYSTFIFKKVEVPGIQLCRLPAVSKRSASDNSKNHVFGMCGVVSSAEQLESPPKKQKLETTAGRSKKPDASTVASNRLEPFEGELKRQRADLPGEKRRQQVEEDHKATKSRRRQSLEPMASWAEQTETNNAAGLGKVTESSDLHSEKSGVHKEVGRSCKYERSPDRGEMCRPHLGTSSRKPVPESRLQAEGSAQKPKRQKLDIAAGHEHHLPVHQVDIMTLDPEGASAEVCTRVDESKNPILKLSTIDVCSGAEQHVLTVQSAGGTPSAAQSESLKVTEQKSAGFKEQSKLAKNPTQGSGLESENNVGCRVETHKTRLKPEQKQDADAMANGRVEASVMPKVDNDKRKANRASRKRWEPVASSASEAVADGAPEKTAQGTSPQRISEATAGGAPSAAQTAEAVVGGGQSANGAGEAVASAGAREAAAVAGTSEAPAVEGTAEAPEPTDDVDKGYPGQVVMQVSRHQDRCRASVGGTNHMRLSHSLPRSSILHDEKLPNSGRLLSLQECGQE